MSLAEQLKNAAARDLLRLHTPGHKGSICELDLTELSDDSFPGEYLAAAENNAARIYGAKHARFLCGGSSQGVKSAIYHADCDGIIDVNSHRSVFDGFTLARKNCITVGERGVTPVTVKQIDGALKRGVKAVVVTTPTYYGFCADVDGIRDYCKRNGLLLIADSAHGAHFGFSPLLPKSVAPLADICNVSTHKTLSALTQSALLFDNLGEAEHNKLMGAVDVMGTTSPSYPLYASIDYAVNKAAEKATADAYEKLYAPIESVKTEYPFLKNDDFTRLVLDCAALNVDSHKLNGALSARGVYSELEDGRHIVFIFTAENGANDVARLSEALYQSVREL